MYRDSDRAQLPYSNNTTFHYPRNVFSVKPSPKIPNTRQRLSYTTISNKTMQLHVSQLILYRSFSGLKHTQKYV